MPTSSHFVVLGQLGKKARHVIMHQADDGHAAAEAVAPLSETTKTRRRVIIPIINQRPNRSALQPEPAAWSPGSLPGPRFYSAALPDPTEATEVFPAPSLPYTRAAAAATETSMRPFVFPLILVTLLRTLSGRYVIGRVPA